MAANETKLSGDDFEAFNRLAVGMDEWHELFRVQWNQIYASVNDSNAPKPETNGKVIFPPPAESPLPDDALLNTIDAFVKHLGLHHDIEEKTIFPQLGARMPAFSKTDVLTQQHVEIHDGLDALAAYTAKVRAGEKKLSRTELREMIDGFAQVTWEHLDEEVVELGADKMSQYWTRAEVEAIPFKTVADMRAMGLA